MSGLGNSVWTISTLGFFTVYSYMISKLDKVVSRRSEFAFQRFLMRFSAIIVSISVRASFNSLKRSNWSC